MSGSRSGRSTRRHSPSSPSRMMPFGEWVPRDALVLDELSEHQALVEQGRHDLAESVVPRVALDVPEFHVVLDVAALRAVDHRDPPSAGTGTRARAGRRLGRRPAPRAPDDPPGRTASARLQEGGHDRGPRTDVGQPAQGPDAGVDEVEGARLEHRRGVHHVGVHEVHVGARDLSDPARLGQRGGGEVQPGHAGAEPRERDRVGTDVALEVHPAQAGQVAQPRYVEADDVTQMVGILGEPGDPVVR